MESKSPSRHSSTPQNSPNNVDESKIKSASNSNDHRKNKSRRDSSDNDERSKRKHHRSPDNDRHARYRSHSSDREQSRNSRLESDERRNRSYYHRSSYERAHRSYRPGSSGTSDSRRRRRSSDHRRRSSSNDQHYKWGRQDNDDSKDKKKFGTTEKEKPNFALSGKLTEERNTYRGVVIKYSEPPEARKPRRRWRLYPFKGEKALQTLYIHRESAYLIGRDRKVVDLPIDHPSCSKQHAALQYRLVPFTRDDGSTGKRVRPYIIDLESANGTFINNSKIDSKKYVELLERDVIKFGFSSREYVLLHENSKDEALDDDVKQEDEEKVAVKTEDATMTAVKQET